MRSRASRLRFAAVLIALSALWTACDDNPVGSDDDHAEADVVALRVGGVTIYAYDLNDGTVDCETDVCGLVLQASDAPQTVSVHFLESDGDDLGSELSGDEYELRVEAADVDIVAILGSDAGKFTFRAEGLVGGQTELRIWLMHGGHEDLSTPPFESDGAVPVTVTE